MEDLNYQHLLYFWAVARYGSVARASEELRFAQQTISGQIRRLENVIGEKLFEREGRRLVLTNVGRNVFRYADEIFLIGQDLMANLRVRPSTPPLRRPRGRLSRRKDPPGRGTRARRSGSCIRSVRRAAAGRQIQVCERPR
jgi:DNA-binding transcriptional LysR family regulator